MRSITMIVLHCSGVKPGVSQDIRRIDEYHRSKGWKCVGYHEYVRRDGSVEHGRPLWMIGAHVVGHNKYSIGICYEGGLNKDGVPEDTRTPEQKKALRELLERLHKRFPKAVIVGHRDLARDGRKCPSFDAASEYRDLQP